MTTRFRWTGLPARLAAVWTLVLLLIAISPGCKQATKKSEKAPENRKSDLKTPKTKTPQLTNCRTRVWNSASQVCPLMPGQQIPSAGIRTIEGKNTNLAAVVKAKPTLLLIYRGGW